MKTLIRITVALLVLAVLVLPAAADVQTIQVTIGANATQIASSDVLCRWVTFQNNTLHNMRLGDRTVTTSRGLLLYSNQTFTVQAQPYPQAPTVTNLKTWYVAGTQGDVIDITCESGN